MESNNITFKKKYSKISNVQRQLVFVLCLLACTTSFVSPPIALLLGILLANLTGHPFLQLNHKATSVLLKFSVVGLGFGINVHSATEAGKEAFLFTVGSIFSILIFGFFLGKTFKIDKKISYLISCGTAICGGSAIAAIAPVVKSDEKQTSIALGVIFILNSVALFVFPAIGSILEMSQREFGLWCAIAIHDTSSVVGAASKYGPEALQIATTVKLARALWIIPVALFTSIIFKNKSSKIKIPYFIGLFILAMLMNTYVSQTVIVAPYLVSAAKMGLTLTLFLIGAGLNINVLKSVGVKPLIQGVLLWVFIAVVALFSIIHFS